MNTLDVINPRNGKVDFHINVHDIRHIQQKSEALRSAQKSWSEHGLEYRCERLSAWAKQIDLHRNEIGEALCTDTGRRAVSHYVVQKVIDSVQYWIKQAPKIIKTFESGASQITPGVKYSHQQVPYPLVGIISPWNFPLTLSLIDAIPALLTGSAILLKPSEVTPRFAVPLQKTLNQVEGLDSVFEIVTGGPQTGMALIDNVDCICFTGSIRTGRKVGVQAAQNFIPAFLELGGKDPAIVTASADLEKAATAIVRSAIGMTGQACQSLERVYVHNSVFNAFLGLLVSKAQAVRLNWPDSNAGQIGPLIFAQQANTIQNQLKDAIAKGAKIQCGGNLEKHDGGIWAYPTVLTNVDHSMQIMTEETFGPIIPVMPFESTKESIALANDSRYGLSAAVFSEDLPEAQSIAIQLEVGAVSINDASLTAFVHDVEKNSFKLSGLGGSRMGDAGFTRFLRKRAILTQTAAMTPLAAFSEGQ